MILVAVDDFLFRSKIRTTGKQAGVELTFPRTPDEVLEQARTLKPSLAIFDLNSAKMAPIDTIARMKQDPELELHPHAWLRLARRRGPHSSRPGCWHRRSVGAIRLCDATRRHSARQRDAQLTLDDIRAAARRIEGRVLRTPLRSSPWLSARTSGDVRLKLETLQPTSSYKVRGAFNTVLQDGSRA